jgi:hypothetical protein
MKKNTFADFMIGMEMEMATTEKPLAFLPLSLIKLYPVPSLSTGKYFET